MRVEVVMDEDGGVVGIKTVNRGWERKLKMGIRSINEPLM